MKADYLLTLAKILRARELGDEVLESNLLDDLGLVGKDDLFPKHETQRNLCKSRKKRDLLERASILASLCLCA